MLRITQMDTPDGGTTLKLEGRVAGPWVGELRRVAEASLARWQQVRLDLSDVTFVSAEGAALLRELLDRRVELGGRSSFAAELLGGGGR